MKLKIDYRERKFTDLMFISNPGFSIEYMNLALGDSGLVMIKFMN